MQRRQFGKKVGAALLLGTLGNTGSLLANSTTKPYKKPIKPARLKKGDTIGLITPGSFISDEGLEKAVTNLETLGFKVKLSKNIRAQNGYNAGTDIQRVDDLHAMFTDSQVAGIWCARGGYGCTRILPYIAYNIIKKNPKALIGYSDITALSNAIYKETGLVGFHGPVASSEMTDYTREHFLAVLVEAKTPHIIPICEENEAMEDEAFHIKLLRPGIAKGRLAGGNLSLLASMAGTPWEVDFDEKLAFIEDIGEKPYRIDRMLTQLRHSSQLEKAAGVALGIFNDCEAGENDVSLSREETILDQVSNIKTPSIYGLSFGHIKNQCTLPIGVEAELNVIKKTLTLLEAGVK